MKRYESSGIKGRSLAWRKDKPGLTGEWVGFPRGRQEEEMLKKKPEDPSEPRVPRVYDKWCVKMIGP